MKDRDLARLIHPAFRFGETPKPEALELARLGVGGFCFYEGSRDEVRGMAMELRSASPGPLLISADYENGAGHWLKEATELPSNMAIGASGSETLARRKGEITAREARALGVDWVLAPVLDLADNPDNPIVNLRAYGDSPALVSRLASAYVSGLRSGGVLCCLKHFPGHGGTSVDSHLVLPVLERSAAELDALELEPFRALLPQADSVMAGHLMAPCIDPERPASLSAGAISGLLRGRMKYEGCVVTDALNMKAVSGGSPGVEALKAGADVLLYPEDPISLFEALKRAAASGEVSGDTTARALARQDAMVRRLSGAGPRPGPEAVGCPEHRAFVREAAPSCLAWAFRNRPYVLNPGETVSYLEPLTAPALWKGRAFVEELVRLGVRVEPFGGQKAGKTVIGSFSRPRAFSGDINLGPEASAEIERALAGGGESLMAAFGSPFVFDRFRGRLGAGLCAFCGLDDFQRAAAAALSAAGRVGGTMPVSPAPGR
ncbi:MAG TPA: glycoside hydrolase family 3 N-terminal domain-containing protein [Elusimicrobiales bacterium]|nr:glycoside hydrolase family 3 N-terminal domain-containing protein [Elusimicrobiales bacterium]